MKMVSYGIINATIVSLENFLLLILLRLHPAPFVMIIRIQIMQEQLFAHNAQPEVFLVVVLQPAKLL